MERVAARPVGGVTASNVEHHRPTEPTHRVRLVDLIGREVPIVPLAPTQRLRPAAGWAYLGDTRPLVAHHDLAAVTPIANHGAGRIPMHRHVVSEATASRRVAK